MCGVFGVLAMFVDYFFDAVERTLLLGRWLLNNPYRMAERRVHSKQD